MWVFSYCILVELEFWDVGFFGGRKTGESREKPLEESKKQQQTQPAYMYGTGSELNPGHIGERQAFTSPLCHPCSPRFKIVLRYTECRLLHFVNNTFGILPELTQACSLKPAQLQKAVSHQAWVYNCCLAVFFRNPSGVSSQKAFLCNEAGTPSEKWCPNQVGSWFHWCILLAPCNLGLDRLRIPWMEHDLKKKKSLTSLILYFTSWQLLEDIKYMYM